MPRDLSPPLPAESAGPAEEVDPELVALPDPPRRERTWTLIVLAVTALVSLLMVVALRRDAAYAFASAVPIDVGDLRDAAPGSLGAARFVTARGALGAAGAIRYERPFTSDTYRISPVLGRRDLWVEVRVPAGEENARYVPPAAFHGRLQPFEESGLRHRGLASAIARTTGEPLPAGAWVVVDGETPRDAGWAVGLMVIFTGFALWNLAALARLLRRAH